MGRLYFAEEWMADSPPRPIAEQAPARYCRREEAIQLERAQVDR